MSSLQQKYSQALSMFWNNAFNGVNNKPNRKLNLPLARIKRLIKVEEDVRMVASEVPILFSLLAEVFVEELTLRSWINMDEHNRRILQRVDIGAAIKTSQMYDFLLDIVPMHTYGRSDMYDPIVNDETIFLNQFQKNNPNFRSYE